MSGLSRMLEVLPPPYTVAQDSVIAQLLNVAALEMDAFQEDLDFYQRSHFIQTVVRLREAEMIGALVNIPRFEWENVDAYRGRLRALVKALLRGAIGPAEIRDFVFTYLTTVAPALVPGLRFAVTADEAFGALRDHPLYRPLRLLENPVRDRASNTLRAVNGRVPYLFRWEEENGGLDDTLPSFQISGVLAGTSIPILVNLTTGQLIGYKAKLRFGQTLRIRSKKSDDRTAVAEIDGADVTVHLFSAHDFSLGTPLAPEEIDPKPLVPQLVRGANEWIFLSIGHYDIRGLNRFFFSMPNGELREGVFDETRFDHAIFPSGTAAQVRMDWRETEPASFEVHVPRYAAEAPGEADPDFTQVGEALHDSIRRLHAAGVRAELRFDPFTEEQRQQERFRLGAKTLDPETGPAGDRDRLTLGGRFGESSLGDSQFE